MASVKTHSLGIIMNGVTGRMGSQQHLMRSIVPIIAAGGVKVAPDEVIVPDPILLGRNAAKLERLSAESGVEKWSTDLDAVLADEKYPVYFDATTTSLRVPNVTKAIAAGKHIYCEKPTALNAPDARKLYELAQAAGVRSGVVQDKLFLPGMRKLKMLRDSGFFGRILSVRGEFGYWVFPDDVVPAQRPSWNYRAADGGGIIFDMFCHWRYVLDELFGNVKAVCCLGATHIPRRVDERGEGYDATADDAAYAMFELDGGIIAQFNSSWCTRVRRDDLLTIHVDGTDGSAVAGLRKVLVQAAGATPRCVWNPDIRQPIDFYDGWTEVPDQVDFDNAFKAQWELFLKHLVTGSPFPWTLLAGAKGVQLAAKGIESWKQRAWVDVPELID